MTSQDRLIKLNGSGELCDRAVSVGRVKILNGQSILYKFDNALDMRNLAVFLRCDPTEITESVYQSYLKGCGLGIDVLYKTAIVELNLIAA